MDAPELKALIGSTLEGGGFRFNRGAWYRTLSDVTQVAQVEKSQYSRRYFLRLAIALRSRQTVPFPKEHQCDIRISPGELDLDRWYVWERLLDLDAEDLPDSERTVTLAGLLGEVVISRFGRLSSVEEIRAAIRERALSPNFVLGDAYSLLVDDGDA